MAEGNQLQMRRPHLEAIPRLTAPRGYGLRTYSVGDEAAWAEIMNRAPLGKDWTPARCRASLTGRPEFWPEELLFATWRGRLVGSACAWPERLDETRVGYVHMVGVLPSTRAAAWAGS